MHVDSVRSGVPAAQWCAGHASGEAAAPTRRSWFGGRKARQAK
jgi:hypothetical protein